jgi:phosphinothricin acetyltransferase
LRGASLNLKNADPNLKDGDASETGTVSLRLARGEDGESVARIYNHYVTTSFATFEEQAVAGSEMSQRIADVQAASLPWWVAETAGTLVGYAYATRWRSRPAYRLSVEITAYVDPKKGGRGIGSALYDVLLKDLRDRGFHAAMAGIALPNDASVALHQRFGFAKVAHFRETGFKLGRWIDVGYWQLLLKTDPISPPA